MGPGFERHWALNESLQGIQKHPGLGAELITAALQSPSTRNRNLALWALGAAGTDHWTNQHRQHLAALAATDPDEKVRQRAQELIPSTGSGT